MRVSVFDASRVDVVNKGGRIFVSHLIAMDPIAHASMAATLKRGRMAVEDGG